MAHALQRWATELLFNEGRLFRAQSLTLGALCCLGTCLGSQNGFQLVIIVTIIIYTVAGVVFWKHRSNYVKPLPLLISLQWILIVLQVMTKILQKALEALRDLAFVYHGAPTLSDICSLPFNLPVVFYFLLSQGLCPSHCLSLKDFPFTSHPSFGIQPNITSSRKPSLIPSSKVQPRHIFSVLLGELERSPLCLIAYALVSM